MAFRRETPALFPLFALATALTAVTYGRTIGDSFLADDFTILARVARVRSLVDACVATTR